MVECITRDRGVAGSSLLASLHCVLEQDIKLILPFLVLVQPRKACPDITEKLKRIKSNQTKKYLNNASVCLCRLKL